MGRKSISRRHARYKMASLVLGTNIVRRELGPPEADPLRWHDLWDSRALSHLVESIVNPEGLAIRDPNWGLGKDEAA